MTSYCVGCDNIVGGESNLIHKVATVLEKAGNTCEELSVGPNYVQSKGKESSSKGKVAVFIVGGSDVGTYVDFMIGLKPNGYYHYKYIYFAFASWTATTDKWITENGLKNTGLVRAHDDNFSKQSDIAPWLGKSADYFFSKNKTNMGYVYGQTPEELANKILSGGTSSSDNKSGSTGSTVKESIQKLLTHWDGEVECRIINDKVYINKIKEPQSNYELVLQEGINIYSDSLQVTDVNPNTVNHLVVTWTKGKITLKDDDLIKRFGENKKEVQAVKKVVKTETVTTTTTTDTSSDTTTDSTTDSTTTSDTTTDTTTDTSSTTDEETTTTETKTTVTEVPIDNYKDALSFANLEWNKIKRDNGHTIECQVQGSSKWRPGQWVKVIIPSFNENGFMYISRASHSDDGGDWNCNLSLVDYPPGWGEEQIETTTEDSEEESSEVTETDTEDA